VLGFGCQFTDRSFFRPDWSLTRPLLSDVSLLVDHSNLYRLPHAALHNPPSLLLIRSDLVHLTVVFYRDSIALVYGFDAENTPLHLSYPAGLTLPHLADLVNSSFGHCAQALETTFIADSLTITTASAVQLLQD
jgi:hypothetical protein